MSMFPDIKNMIFSKILYFPLFPVVFFSSCHRGETPVIQSPQPVPVYDMEKLPKASVYIKAEERIMNLSQQQKQQYVAISATKDKRAVSLRGNVKNIGKKNLTLMFEKNPYKIGRAHV